MPTDRLIREAEMIVIRRKLSQPKPPSVRGTVPPGLELELVEEPEAE